VVANLRPSGEILMEDFNDAGGLPALVNGIRDRLHGACRTVSGKTLGEDIDGARVFNDAVILPVERPLSRAGGTFVLRGNLAPDGCVIKPVCAEPRLLRHTGPAVVFRDYADLKARIDSDTLDVTPDSVLVLQNAGPIGGPGMPEWGMLPIPRKLLRQGVRDMVRVSDARMSGTSYGTCVLHVSPESAVGGPLALVCDGDPIELDVAARRIDIRVPEDDLARRRADWQSSGAASGRFGRGYGRLFSAEVTQAHEGCDFRFLHGGAPTAEPEIY
jgi:dihydroxy-acid dehydratase